MYVNILIFFQTKINYLRSQYCREVNKHHELIRNGENVEEIYTPTPYWFEKLNFLNRFIKVRKSKLSDTMEYESGSVSIARIH